MNVTDLVQGRFEQLRRSGFSDRPEIFKSAWGLIRANPITGVGPGAFPWHAESAFRRGLPVMQAHNVFLTLGAEYGVPATLVWISMLVAVGVMSVRNFRVLGRTPGYAFIVQGSYAALFAITAQSFFVYIFADRNVGYAYYTLFAIIVIVNRFIREGQLTPDGELFPPGAPRPPNRIWAE
jgi:O-antigen ligase